MLATFSVSNIGDAGLGSLRQAILDANNQAGLDSIEFDPGVFATPQTIDLSSSLPTITEDVTIAGPGAEFLTLDGGHGLDNLPGTGDGYRLLDIDDGSPAMINVAISGLTLTGGDVSGKGGAIQSREHLTVTDSAIVENATGPGTDGGNGAAGQNGSDGTRGGDGGGIFSSGGNLMIVRSTVSGNFTGRGGNGGHGGDGADGTNGQDGGHGGHGESGGYGGGLFTDGGNLVIADSTISGNTTGAGGLSGDGGDGGDADFGGASGVGGDGGDGGYGGNGGGIYSSVGEITITGSTISGNRAGSGATGGSGGEGGLGAAGGDGGDGGSGGNGGGMYSVEGELQVSMSTITANLAGNAGEGGEQGLGGFAGSQGSEGNGGGLNSLGNDPLLIDNSIIAGNQSTGVSPDLVAGAITLNIDYSLIGNGDGLVISSGTGNQIGTTLSLIDPKLGPLADNGGETNTHAPLPASPAIDMGDPSIMFNASEFDQRGLPYIRVEDGDTTSGSVIDIGSYEVQAPPSADFDQDGDVDGTDFLAWQRGFGITSGAFLVDGNSDDDEDVDASDLAVWSSTYGQGSQPLAAQQDASSALQPTGKLQLAAAAAADLAMLAVGASTDDDLPVEITLSASVTLASVTIEAKDTAYTAFAAPTTASSTESAEFTRPTAESETSSSANVELTDELISSLL